MIPYWIEIFAHEFNLSIILAHHFLISKCRKCMHNCLKIHTVYIFAHPQLARNFDTNFRVFFDLCPKSVPNFDVVINNYLQDSMLFCTEGQKVLMWKKINLVFFSALIFAILGQFSFFNASWYFLEKKLSKDIIEITFLRNQIKKNHTHKSQINIKIFLSQFDSAFVYSFT